MAKFFLEVEKHLGEPFVKIIMASASGGKVTDQDIKRFAQLLGYCSDQNSNKVYGNHTTLMERNKDIQKDEAMREILSDWWNEELHQLLPKIGKKKVIKSFEEINKSVAYCLKEQYQKDEGEEYYIVTIPSTQNAMENQPSATFNKENKEITI